MEQHVDIPVPGGRGRLAGLQGSLPGQSSTAPSVEQIVHILGGGLQGLRPRQVQRRLHLFTLQLVRMMTRMSLVQGFSALFPG